MLKFTKKIRLILLRENKFSGFLLYGLGEIILVVIGILIALNINNWNEVNKNQKIEKDYLVGMLEDSENNLEKSKDVINRIEEMVPIMLGLLEQSALDKVTISVDSLNFAFSYLSDMPAYSSTDRIYNNLIGSGDLKLIRNNELKTILADYYKSLFIINLVQNTHESELVESFQPYILEHLDFQAVHSYSVEGFELPQPVENDIILNVVHDRKFRNIITLKYTILTDLLDLYRGLEEINKSLVDLLKSLTSEKK